MDTVVCTQTLYCTLFTFSSWTFCLIFCFKEKKKPEARLTKALSPFAFQQIKHHVPKPLLQMNGGARFLLERRQKKKKFLNFFFMTALENQKTHMKSQIPLPQANNLYCKPFWYLKRIIRLLLKHHRCRLVRQLLKNSWYSHVLCKIVYRLF